MKTGPFYSDLKMLWHYRQDEGLPKAPKQVQVVLSDLCNQSCGFCAYRMDGYTSNELFVGDSEKARYGKNNPKRWMDTERALALVDEIKAAGCEAIQFTGGGEPTVHPDHEAVFAKTLDVGLEAALVSNGYRWSPRLIADILPRFAWVRVSVDAGTPMTYAEVRQAPTHAFAKVLANTTRLAEAIAKAGSACVLGVGYVVTPDNYGEILDGVERAKNTGAAYVRMAAMFNPDGTKPYERIYPVIKDTIADAKERYEDDTFRVVNLFGERLQDLEDGSPDYGFCAYQHYTSYVGGDMQAYRCCVYSYSKRGRIDGGDLNDRRFDEFWKSADRKADFDRFDARGCERCQFNAKNRSMAYVLGPKPPHSEFP